MLTFTPDRPVQTPTPAATLLLLRTTVDASDIEVFCVRRHNKSAFLGGAVVFPGGKLDPDDSALDWRAVSNGVHARAAALAAPPPPLAWAVCACRESLEEAALLPCCNPLDDGAVRAVQQALAEGASLHEWLQRGAMMMDTASLHPFARWVTPEAEQRRFDAVFFLAAAPTRQLGHHDQRETTAGQWVTPTHLIGEHARGACFLAPPTLRALELLSAVRSVDAALALADQQSLAPICPKVISFDPLTLVLPGDSQHPIAEARVAGPTRFIMRDGNLYSSADPNRPPQA